MTTTHLPASTSTNPSPSSNPPNPTPGFPTLLPAFTFTFHIGSPSLVGGLSLGRPLTVVPILSGAVRTEASWSKEKSEGGAGKPALNGGLRGQGVDYVRNDPDGKRMRLDAGVVVSDDVAGDLVHIHYTGVVDINPELSAILGGSSAAKTTDFGNSFINVTFESGCERFKELETGVFVGAGRFVVDERGLSSEYKVSKVVMGG